MEAKVKEVLEVDQHTSTGDFSGLSIDSFKTETPIIHGGDADAARVIHGGWFKIKTVTENERPLIGRVWLIDSPEGLKTWKSNYDTSD